MQTLLNELYFNWLTAQIHCNYKHNSTSSYDGLMHALHEKEFVWMVPNDDNRLADGLELRYHFLQDERLQEYAPFREVTSETIAIFRNPQHNPCSMLEVIVALSKRLAFQAQGEPGWWAWKLIENINLHKMKDPFGRRKAEQTEDVLHQLIWRTYPWDGVGGFFPLAFPQEDQTRIEIWYQMAAYLQEQYSV
jgi:hypothetical protein